MDIWYIGKKAKFIKMKNSKPMPMVEMESPADTGTKKDKTKTGKRINSNSEMQFGLKPVRRSVAELKTFGLYRDAICEGVATFVLLFVITSVSAGYVTGEEHVQPSVTSYSENGNGTATTVSSPLPQNDRSIFEKAFTIGFTVFAMIEATGHLCLCSLNPTVILMFVLTARLSVIRGLVFLMTEILGASAGVWCAMAIMPQVSADTVSGPGPGLGMSTVQAMFGDFILGGVLVFVIIGALDDSRRSVVVPGLPVGVTVAVLISIGAPFSGGVLNPVVSTAFAIVTGTWKHVWIYWVADIAGALAAIFIYWFVVFEYKTSPDSNNNEIDAKVKQDKQEDTALI